VEGRAASLVEVARLDEPSKLRPEEEDVFLLLTDPARKSEAAKPLLRLLGALAAAILRKKYSHMTDEDIDEVIEDAVLKAIRSAETYDDRKGSVTSWFVKIVKNTAIDRWRAGTREERREQARVKARDDPDFRAFESDVKREVMALSERQRLILLCDLEMYPTRASAKLLARQFDTTVAVVYTERSRAYEHLEGKIGRRAPGGRR
jgi:RNA polymerase sigma factor (sigma-70 family)